MRLHVLDRTSLLVQPVVLVRVDDQDHDVRVFRIELLAAGFRDFLAHDILWKDVAVAAFGGHGIVGVSDGDDARVDRNGIALDAVGIAGAVVALMMPARADLELWEFGDIVEDVVADDGVLLDDRVLFICEARRLAQDGLWDADLPMSCRSPM